MNLRWYLHHAEVFLLLSVVLASGPRAQSSLYSCLGTDSICTDSSARLVDASCGQQFFVHQGKIAWPPLTYIGPVTISVNTKAILPTITVLPLYIQIVALPETSTTCTTQYPGGGVVLVATGADQCGGTWESVGPLDLRSYGLLSGSRYQVQAVFLELWNGDNLARTHSAALSCIRVVAEPDGIATGAWGMVKSLYKVD